MVDLDTVDPVCLCDASYGHSLWVRVRVALGCAYHRGSGARLPLNLRYAGLQVTLRTTKGYFEEVRLEQWQKHLRLRIAEAAIVFQQHGAITREHEAPIKNSDVGSAVMC